MEPFETEIDDIIYTIKLMSDGRYAVYVDEICTGNLSLEITENAIKWTSNEFYENFIDAVAEKIEEHLRKTGAF